MIGNSIAVIINRMPIKNRDDDLVQAMRQSHGQNATLYVRNPDITNGTNFNKLISILTPSKVEIIYKPWMLFFTTTCGERECVLTPVPILV